MKVAYLSVSRDGTGYAHQANDLILALDAAGVDVVSIWTSLSSTPNNEIPERIKELEKKDIEGVNIVIQHTLPHFFVRQEGLYNIGVFSYETTNFSGSSWQYHCNLMDEIWVFNADAVEACKQSGVTVPIREIDFCTDASKFKKTHKNLIDELNNRFVFYTIGEFGYRKNLNGLLASYYSEFDGNDNVVFLVKTFVSAHQVKETEKLFDQMVNELQSHINKGPYALYPQIILLSEWLSEDQIMQLHQCGDCFVTSSRGEAECIPLLDAAMMGNLCVAPCWAGPRKIAKRDMGNVYLTECMEKPVFGVKNSYPFLYMANETWFEPQMLETMKYMRHMYESSNRVKREKSPQEEFNNHFSHKTVGKKLKDILKDALNKKGNEAREPVLLDTQKV